MAGWQFFDTRNTTTTIGNNGLGADDVVFVLDNPAITGGSNALSQTNTGPDFPRDAENQVIHGALAISPINPTEDIDTITATLGSVEDSGFVDVSIVFGFQDASNFYMASASQNGEMFISRVVNGDRRASSYIFSNFDDFDGSVSWDATLVHNAAAGTATLTVSDGTITQSVTATDAELVGVNGLIGIGTNNDAWSADNISVTSATSTAAVATVDSLDLQSGSTLAFDVVSTSAFDRLVIEGAFNADGTIQLNEDVAFVGANGDSYDILDFDAELVTGTPTFDLPSLDSGLFWDTQNVLLSGVLSIDVAGDYNGDGVVDAADYTVWRDNDGMSVVLPGDTTPGTVDASDYTVWVSNFGNSFASVAATSAVPEPSSLLLLLLTIGMCAVRRRK